MYLVVFLLQNRPYFKNYPRSTWLTKTQVSIYLLDIVNMSIFIIRKRLELCQFSYDHAFFGDLCLFKCILSIMQGILNLT